MAINTEYPAPQADRLDKVAIVVDAVDAGANTAPGIAQALDMVERQGAYYANAAAYLGLIQHRDTVPATYVLTPEGQHLLDAPADVRVESITELVRDVPAVALLLDGALADVEAYYASLGLDSHTASRRAATARVWASALDNHDLDADAVNDGAHAARQRAAEIAATIAVRRARIEAPAPACPTCFTQLPATGECGYCW